MSLCLPSHRSAGIYRCATTLGFVWDLSLVHTCVASTLPVISLALIKDILQVLEFVLIDQLRWSIIAMKFIIKALRPYDYHWHQYK